MNSRFLNRIQYMDAVDFLRQLKSQSVDVVITDPPFGIAYQSKKARNRKPFKILDGDDKCFDYSIFASECYRVLKDNTAFFAFTSWRVYSEHFIQLRGCGFDMKEPLICEKLGFGIGNLAGTFKTNVDWVLFAHKGRFRFRKTRLIRNYCAGQERYGKPSPEYKYRFPSCWYGSGYPKSSEVSSSRIFKYAKHPTVKGLQFIKWLILLSTSPGDVVLDPFMGSGTTAVAAKQLGRGFLGCEKNKGFYDLCKRRIKFEAAEGLGFRKLSQRLELGSDNKPTEPK